MFEFETIEVLCGIQVTGNDGKQENCGAAAFASVRDVPACFWHLLEEHRRAARPLPTGPLKNLRITLSDEQLQWMTEHKDELGLDAEQT